MSRIDATPIEALVASYATEHSCPTVAWGVVADGELAASGGWVSDVAPAPPSPVDSSTVYRIASMTKSFSAAATLWLRDRGVLRLDDAIGVHDARLTSLRSPTGDAPPITIRDLLAMSSGLATDDPWADRHLDLTDDEFDAIVAAGCVFGEPTGACYEYSNFGYAVLGRVVHRASGRRIQQIVSDELLAPLGMADTTWHMPDHTRWVPPLRVDEATFVAELPPLGDGLIAPMGGIWTTVADLARWVTWLAEAFPPRDDVEIGPLSRASRREMQTIQRYVGIRDVRGVRLPSGYGYGLRVLDDPALGTVISHSGGVPGYGSNMRWLPGRGVGVITLSNVTYAPMTELGARILDVVHQQGVGARQPRPVPQALRQATVQLVALLSAWDDGSARALFADNVAPDEHFDRRRAIAERTIIAPPLTLGRIVASSDAAATAHCTDRAGNAYRLTLSLAPLAPTAVQEYEIEPQP